MFDSGFNVKEYISTLDTKIKSLGAAPVVELYPSHKYYQKVNIGGIKEVSLTSIKNITSEITSDFCRIRVTSTVISVSFVDGTGYNSINLSHNKDLNEYMINDVSTFKQQMTNCGYNITYVQEPVTKEDLFNLNLKYDMVSELFAVMKIVQDNIDVFYKELEEDF